ncbi:hypothetical protein DBR46_14365 [Pseudomonas sp. KBW05]|nr:hypothetical protein DBR46_14365 [Pseudomonas sp. KBW05]
MPSTQIEGGTRSCGSGLAREGSVSVSIFGTDTPLSRASPLPQGDVFTRGYWRRPAAPGCRRAGGLRIPDDLPQPPPPCHP